MSHVHGPDCEHDHGHGGHDHGHAEHVASAQQAVASLTGQAMTEMQTLDPAAAWQQHATPTDLLTVGIKQGSLAMCEAVCREHPEALHGRDSNDQATPAHWCALLGNVELLEWLGTQGSPLTEMVTSSGMQPIHWACTRGHVEVVKALIRLGASIDAVDIKHTTPLVIAAQYDHTLLVFYLIKARADHTILDDCKDSALHWAAYKGNVHTVGLLHYLGLTATAIDSFGSSPLHLATAQGAVGAVEYFLESSEADALLDMKDEKGRTALAVAKERNHVHVQRLIQRVKPAWHQKLIECFMGKGGEKVMFVFFWVNSWVTYATYFFMIMPAVGTVAQHWVYLVANAGMYYCFVTASLTECGTVPMGGKQQAEYERALTLAADGNMDEAGALPLCHTCHIVRPLRSKHCTVQKRCVAAFDHFCPYVNNTMGARNYKYFILFMAFGLVGVSMTAVACLQYLLLVGRSNWIVFQLVDYIVFTTFGVTMNGYHAHLVTHNLTTNEHINKTRYHYLKDDAGRFSNAFDRGCLANIADFWGRAANCEANPYYYTDRYNQKEAAGAKGPPGTPRSPSGSCSGEDDELMGNDVEAGGRA